MPYQVNKAAMLSKILGVTEQRKEMFAGVSGHPRRVWTVTGIRAVIEVRKDYDAKKVLNCLYKYSDLQVTFGVNMVCIADGQPKQLSLMEIVDHYIPIPEGRGHAAHPVRPRTGEAARAHSRRPYRRGERTSTR